LEPHDGGDDVYLQPLNVLERPADETDASPPDEKSITSGLRRLLTKATLDPDRVDNVVSALDPRMLSDKTQQLWSDEIKQWGQDTLDNLGVSVNFSMTSPAVQQHLTEFSATSIQGLVDATTRNALRDTLVVGTSQGEGIRDLRQRIEDVFDVADRTRADLIARTEVLRSSNYATWQAHKESGVVDNRQWISTPDRRLRDAHAELDGQIRAIDKPFEVQGQTAMHPGGFGVGELDIGCRCTTSAVFSERRVSAEVEKQIWLDFIRKTEPWTNKAAAKLKEGFREQLVAVLSALSANVI
jgi:SPP1 gp7 family putative phage head morphogenesis protein